MQPAFPDPNPRISRGKVSLTRFIKGTPSAEVLANSPSFSLGIPSAWVTDWWIIERGVVAERFDPNDPPIYEAEATYLKRNKLLLEREGARLTVLTSSLKHCRGTVADLRRIAYRAGRIGPAGQSRWDAARQLVSIVFS